MAKTSVPCEACGKPVYKADEFCESCGQRVSDEAKERIQLAIRAKKEAREEQAEQEDRHRREREVRVKKAAQMVGILAVLFFLGGLLGYVMAQDTKNKALANLAGLDANATVTLDGVNHNVAELRKQVENEPTMVLVVNFTLTVIFIGLYFWARKAPFPAIVTAFAVFVVVHFVNFLFDPTTIVQGLLIKIIGVAVLVAGIKAALADRAASAKTAPG